MYIDSKGTICCARHITTRKMNNYNPNINHRRSIRLKGYDYSQAGLYFITICINDRKCLFGEIIDGKMILNDAGKIAYKCWLEIPEHFPDTVLHEHIIMPNHVHGIIELIQSVGVQNFEPLQSQNESASNFGVQNFEPQQNQFQKIIPHSIGSIIRGYKIGVTKWFRNNTDNKNIWQRNYYEHIIRDEKSHQRISEYIRNNPNNWNKDDFFNE
jgi:putative transposase